MKPRVLIFTRRPGMGVSKTRLARDIGPTRALQVKRELDAHTLREARSPCWQTEMWVADRPSCTIRLPGVWPPATAHAGRTDRKLQARGKLGVRLAHAFGRPGPAPATVVIGTDCPALSRSHIARTFALLRRHDAVIGPARDGGFYLLGLRRQVLAHWRFEPVRWSSPHTLADLLALQPARLKLGWLPMQSDLDSGTDLALWRSGRRPGQPRITRAG